MALTIPAGAGLRFTEVPPEPALEVDLATGPATSFAGLRVSLAVVAAAGAEFAGLPQRYPAEWSVLTGGSDAAGMSEVALSASERRLHRESEQAFRVLVVGARALCDGSAEVDRAVLIRGLGRTDLVSLRGMVRAAEYSLATGRGRLFVHPGEALQVDPWHGPASDYRAERARALRLLGLAVDATDLRPGAGAQYTVDGPASLLYARALDPDTAPRPRFAAAVALCRRAFYGSNWEAMARVAEACLPIVESLTVADMAALSDEPLSAGGDDNQAIEFEPALLRHPADMRGYLLKVLGIQATFRGDQDSAIGYFRAIRDVDAPVSAELLAQSHLYSALTLTKRKQRLPEATAELDAGFAAVAATHAESTSHRRERGWLHNLRALTLFSTRDLAGALDHEKAALGCIDGLGDASSVHLRVNLVSNISVLQESAGKPEQALHTWQRLGTVGSPSDANFVKHHSYRTGGLQVRAADADGGEANLRESLRLCVQLADDFHECEIATELGALLLLRGHRADQAAELLEQAALAADRLGDPYRMARGEVGRAAATGRSVSERVQLALASRTHAAQARSLLDGHHGGADPVTLLPTVRTKLNRPFDLVNI